MLQMGCKWVAKCPACLQHTIGFVQVPFGGSFHNLVRWCAWTEPRSGKAHLQVSCDVVFTARWVPAKGIINSSSIEVRRAGSFRHVIGSH